MFHKNLEDYLQDGLDFPNRFAIERHARECFSCRKDLAGAIELRRMALDLKRVKAPADFEISLLDKIGKCKSHSRASAIRRLWFYGPDWLSWKKLMLASSSLAVLMLGIIVTSHWKAAHTAAPPPVVANHPEKEVKEKTEVSTKEASFEFSRAVVNRLKALPIPRIKDTPKAVPVSLTMNDLDNPVAPAPDYFKVVVAGSDVRPEPMRMLPKKIRLQYIPASEEYFLYYVSH